MKIYAQQTAKTIYRYRTIESKSENERLIHKTLILGKKDFQFDFFFTTMLVYFSKEIRLSLCLDVAWINWDNAF